MAERPYYVENIVGDARTRMHRANAVQTQRNKLFIGGQRLLPGGKLPLTAEAFKKAASQLEAMVLEGKVILTTPDRMRITSRWTGEFIITRSDGAVKMLPKGEKPDCFKGVEPVAVVEAEPPPPPKPAPPPPLPPPPEPEVVTSAPEPEAPVEAPVEEPKYRSRKKR